MCMCSGFASARITSRSVRSAGSRPERDVSSRDEVVLLVENGFDVLRVDVFAADDQHLLAAAVT